MDILTGLIAKECPPPPQKRLPESEEYGKGTDHRKEGFIRMKRI
jgi:hypothetical protein